MKLMRKLAAAMALALASTNIVRDRALQLEAYARVLMIEQ